MISSCKRMLWLHIEFPFSGVTVNSPSCHNITTLIQITTFKLLTADFYQAMELTGCVPLQLRSTNKKKIKKFIYIVHIPHEYVHIRITYMYINWNLEMLVFEERGKLEFLEKTFQSKDRITNNKLNPHCCCSTTVVSDRRIFILTIVVDHKDFDPYCAG